MVLARAAPLLPSVRKNTANPTGTTVARLLGKNVTDVDVRSVRGLAVIGFAGTNGGTWQYSATGGRTWLSLNTATARTARLLKDTDLVRFLPKHNFVGRATLVFRAWDRTTGIAGGTANLASASATGRATAFSSGTETATVAVV